MDHPTLIYPCLREEAAAAHLDLLGGIIEERIIPEQSPEDDGDFSYVYDPEKLAEDEHERAIAAFRYEIYNLEDAGLVVIDGDNRMPTATDAGRAWFDRMQADLEAIIAIDQDRVYLVQRTDADGYLHAYEQTEDDEFDASAGIDLTHLREAGLIDWGGDMVAFITTLGGEFLDAYRPELFDPQEVAA